MSKENFPPRFTVELGAFSEMPVDVWRTEDNVNRTFDCELSMELEIAYRCHLATLDVHPNTLHKTLSSVDTRTALARLMYERGLTEHGGSVRGGWLTEKGVKICKLAFELKPADAGDGVRCER